MNKVFWDIIHHSFTDVWNASLGFSTGAKKSYTLVWKKKKISLMNTCSLNPESVSHKIQSHSLLNFRLSIWTRGKKKNWRIDPCVQCAERPLIISYVSSELPSTVFNYYGRIYLLQNKFEMKYFCENLNIIAIFLL